MKPFPFPEKVLWKSGETKNNCLIKVREHRKVRGRMGRDAETEAIWWGREVLRKTVVQWGRLRGGNGLWYNFLWNLQPLVKQYATALVWWVFWRFNKKMVISHFRLVQDRKKRVEGRCDNLRDHQEEELWVRVSICRMGLESNFLSDLKEMGPQRYTWTENICFHFLQVLIEVWVINSTIMIVVSSSTSFCSLLCMINFQRCHIYIDIVIYKPFE